MQSRHIGGTATKKSARKNYSASNVFEIMSLKRENKEARKKTAGAFKMPILWVSLLNLESDNNVTFLVPESRESIGWMKVILVMP